jgi:Gram-negative bacterial TonB protein C-terminal
VRILIGVLVLIGVLTLTSRATAQDFAEVLPEVIAHAEVTYPPLARQARIQGDVRVKITTDGELVKAAEAETGSPILRKGAEENVRTWKFAAHTPGTFDVTFRYKLLSGNVEVEFLESPGVVQIGAGPVEMIVDYTDVGLGSWKAEFKSQDGMFSQVFELYYSGPSKGEWVDGKGVGPKGEKEEIEWGHKDGDYLVFAIALPTNSGRRTKAVLLGKMIGNRIVGTFVNEVGARGEWTAVRMRERVKSE